MRSRSRSGSRSTRALVSAALVVAGLATALPPAALAANPEGALDTSFSGDGKLPLPQSGISLAAEGGLRMPDGRILITGGWETGTGRELFVMRLTASGALDTTFSGDGIFHQPLGDHGFGRRVALQSDGKIVVVGDTTTGFTLARLTTSGALDTTFAGGTGFVDTTLVTADSNANNVLVTPEGRILIAGEANNVSSDAFVAAYTSKGTLDTTFAGGTGIRVVGFDTFDYYASLALASDGSILAAGASQNNSDSQLLVTRLTPAGALDTSFSGDGSYLDQFDPNTSARAVAVDQFDRPVVVGGGTSSFVLRLTKGGDGDATFTGDGVTLWTGSSADAVALAANGRIVVAGNNGAQESVRRFDVWGNADASFGSEGETSTDITGSSDIPLNVAIAPDGRITVIGSSSTSDFAPYLTRYIGDATVPYGAKLVGLPAISTSTSRTLGWTASDDNTGVASYTILYRSAAYGSSSLSSTPTTWKSNTTATSGSFTGSAGRQYCFTVRAKDVAGNTGAYGPRQCVIFPVNDRSLTRSGSWSSLSSSAYYKGTASSSTSSGATLKLTGVKYRRLTLVATRCSTCGTVKVYLGSKLLNTISLAGSSKSRVLYTIDVKPDLQSGTITIKQASGGKKTIIEGLAVGLY